MDPFGDRVKRSQGSSCGDIWIDGDVLFGGIAALGLAFAFLLNEAITMAGRRRRKRNAQSQYFGTNRELINIGNNNMNVQVKGLSSYRE
jgi:hypothetical protein